MSAANGRERFDIHVHSGYSHDGRSSIAEYDALLARDAGPAAIGLAEHVDFLPECGGYGTFDTQGYHRAAAASPFRGTRLFAGAEIDYSTLVESDIRAALDAAPWDFTIASVHIVSSIPFSTAQNKERFISELDFRALLEEYFAQVTASLAFPRFDAIGHIGIFKRYMEAGLLERMGLSDFIRRKEAALAEACARSGKIVEINTSGYGSASGTTFPDEGFLRLYRDAGGRRIAFGSDAHSASAVCSDFGRAETMAASIGFGSPCRPWER
jgi:histidinol-phosphatase (PHP family)